VKSYPGSSRTATLGTAARMPATRSAVLVVLGLLPSVDWLVPSRGDKRSCGLLPLSAGHFPFCEPDRNSRSGTVGPVAGSVPALQTLDRDAIQGTLRWSPKFG